MPWHRKPQKAKEPQATMRKSKLLSFNADAFDHELLFNPCDKGLEGQGNIGSGGWRNWNRKNVLPRPLLSSTVKHEPLHTLPPCISLSKRFFIRLLSNSPSTCFNRLLLV